MSIENLKNAYDFSIRCRAFPLHPEIADEGVEIKDLFAGYPFDIDDMRNRMKKTADSLGLPIGELSKTFNTRLAQELGAWAERKGKGELFHQAAFRTYFVDGKNLADHQVLESLATSVGLSGEEARHVIHDRSFSETVDRDWASARERRITAVPTFIMGKQQLVGAQSYETMEKMLIERNGVKRRSD